MTKAEIKTIAVGTAEETPAAEPGFPAPQQDRRFVPQVTPMPQRIVKPAPLTLDQIKESLIEAGNQIDAAREQFVTDNESLDAFYSERLKIKSEIADLQAQLREKQERLAELDASGSPRDKFAASVVASERTVAGLGGALLTTLANNAAIKIFGIPFEELSKDSQGDVQARYRKVLGRFVSGFYLRLGRTQAQANVDQVEARASGLLDDIDQLLTSGHFAE